jgi:hypothetical protein
MVGSGWELAARELGIGVPVYVVKNSNFPGMVELWKVTAPGQLPTFVIRSPIPVAHPHFPYGANVQPD